MIKPISLLAQGRARWPWRSRNGAEDFLSLTQLATAVADMGWALDTGEVTEEEPVPVSAKWPIGVFQRSIEANPETPKESPGWKNVAGGYGALGFAVREPERPGRRATGRGALHQRIVFNETAVVS